MNHTITGLYIDRPTEYFVGLFGYIQSAAISNLILDGGVDLFVRGRQSVGALAGTIDYSTVDNITIETYSNAVADATKGIVAVDSLAGGLAGGAGVANNNTTFSNITVTGIYYRFVL